MQGPLQFAQQPLQPPAPAPGGRQVIGDHPRMAEIQQKGGLLGGEAQEMLVVVVDDSHQAFKRNQSFVGRNSLAWMGKAVRPAPAGPVCPPEALTRQRSLRRWHGAWWRFPPQPARRGPWQSARSSDGSRFFRPEELNPKGILKSCRPFGRKAKKRYIPQHSDPGDPAGSSAGGQ